MGWYVRATHRLAATTAGAAARRAARGGTATRWPARSWTACDQALRVLARALPLDAATLLSIDSLTGADVQVAGIGYTAETSRTLAAEFVTTPWYRSALRRELPPSISEDAEDPG